MFEFREALRFAAFCLLAFMPLWFIVYTFAWFINFARTPRNESEDSSDT